MSSSLLLAVLTVAFADAAEAPALKQLRVHILSASDRPEDIQRAYELGADSYLVKPSSLDELLHLAKSLLAWLKLSHIAPVKNVAESHEPAPVGGDAQVHEPSQHLT